MSGFTRIWIVVLVFISISQTVHAQNLPPACVAAKLADYSELECTVNNLDFKFAKVTFARNPDPKTIDIAPVSNPDGLRFVLPAIPKSDDAPSDPSDANVTPFFITFNPTFSYHVKALKKPLTGVIVEGRTPPRNESSGEPSRNTELLFAPGESPTLLDMLRLAVFENVRARLTTPLALGQPLKAGDQMTFVNEAGTPSFTFTNRFPSD